MKICATCNEPIDRSTHEVNGKLYHSDCAEKTSTGIKCEQCREDIMLTDTFIRYGTDTPEPFCYHFPRCATPEQIEESQKGMAEWMRANPKDTAYNHELVKKYYPESPNTPDNA